MKRFSITTIFWALVGVFVVIVIDMPISMLIPALKVYLLPLAFISWVAFFILGLALIVSIKKKKAEGLQGWLKKFLLLTGASAVGFPVFAILHNLVYGLFIYFFGQDFWERVGLGDEPFFFLLAIIVCPLGFLVGVIGTIVLFLKKGKRQ
jgi:hypothetical protein